MISLSNSTFLSESGTSMGFPELIQAFVPGATFRSSSGGHGGPVHYSFDVKRTQQSRIDYYSFAEAAKKEDPGSLNKDFTVYFSDGFDITSFIEKSGAVSFSKERSGMETLLFGNSLAVLFKTSSNSQVSFDVSSVCNFFLDSIPSYHDIIELYSRILDSGASVLRPEFLSSSSTPSPRKDLQLLSKASYGKKQLDSLYKRRIGKSNFFVKVLDRSSYIILSLSVPYHLSLLPEFDTYLKDFMLPRSEAFMDKSYGLYLVLEWKITDPPEMEKFLEEYEGGFSF